MTGGCAFLPSALHSAYPELHAGWVLLQVVTLCTAAAVCFSLMAQIYIASPEAWNAGASYIPFMGNNINLGLLLLIVSCVLQLKRMGHYLERAHRAAVRWFFKIVAAINWALKWLLTLPPFH